MPIIPFSFLRYLFQTSEPSTISFPVSPVSQKYVGFLKGLESEPIGWHSQNLLRHYLILLFLKSEHLFLSIYFETKLNSSPLDLISLMKPLDLLQYEEIIS